MHWNTCPASTPVHRPIASDAFHVANQTQKEQDRFGWQPGAARLNGHVFANHFARCERMAVGGEAEERIQAWMGRHPFNKLVDARHSFYPAIRAQQCCRFDVPVLLHDHRTADPTTSADTLQ
jgi:hypothetical protein